MDSVGKYFSSLLRLVLVPIEGLARALPARLAVGQRHGLGVALELQALEEFAQGGEKLARVSSRNQLALIDKKAQGLVVSGPGFAGPAFFQE